MKNLKKVLALVLAVCMAFSLVTFASAATTPKVQDYKDASSIKQTEAVDLLTAAGILNGTDGSFNPTANVTREQAAKIICYMLLGGKGAEALKTTSSSFSDVAASRWSAGSIQYCVVKGIINGMGNGTFAPEGNVTASQFSKMLLTAVGYGKNGEYTGANWEINVISDAQNLKILSLNLDVTAAATREQVAQYAFNAYTKVALVSYSKDISDYVKKTYNVTEDGATVVKPYSIAYQQGYTASAKDDMGMYNWRKDGVALSNNRYSSTDFTTLGTNTLATSIVSLSNPNSSSYIAQADSGVKYFVNGTYTKPSSTTAYTLSDVDTITAAAGYGTVTKLIDTDDNGKYNQVQVTERKACVVSAPSTVSAAGMVTIPGVAINGKAINGIEQAKVKGVTTFDKNDVAIVSYDVSTATFTVEKATKVQGQMTSGSSIMITFGGKTYFGFTGNAVPSKSLATFASDMTANLNVAATAYVDSYGYIVSIAADDITSSKTYGIAYGYQHDGAMKNTASIRILKQDGTICVYSQAPDSTGVVKDLGLATTITNGALVSYTITTDGKAKVKVESPDTATVTSYKAKATDIVTSQGTYYISATTKVFYFTGTYSDGSVTPANKGSMTTGYANTVALETADGPFTVKYIKNSLAPTVVDAILIGYKADNVSSGINYAYTIYGGSPTTRQGTDGILYNDYTVYVDGVSKTLSAPVDVANVFCAYNADYDKIMATGGLYTYTLDAKGNISSTAIATSIGTDKAWAPIAPYNGKGTAASDYQKGDITYIDASGNYFVFNDSVAAGKNVTKAVLTNSSTKYYLVNNSMDKFPFGEFTKDAAISTSAVDSGTGKGTHYKVLNWAVDSNGVATQVYFSYVTDAQ